MIIKDAALDYRLSAVFFPKDFEGWTKTGVENRNAIAAMKPHFAPLVGVTSGDFNHNGRSLAKTQDRANHRSVSLFGYSKLRRWN
ncbi:MAG: hypothetical protein ACXV8A_04365 [Chthoniobacterales bacterium]